MPKNVVVRHCANPFEAEFFKSYLRSEGIRAFADGEDSTLWTGRYAILGRGCRVWAPEAEAERARDLLERAPEPETGDAADEEEPETDPGTETALEPAPPPPVSCPQCRSAAVQEIQTRRPACFLKKLFTFGLCGARRERSWTCRDCGCRWSA